ncbi:uncharacterized protein LOC123693349 [Colias croceus]|uniref:uncharacterized protein LOC123693349 n=1 Tax=Colias crocea TaxID=72248 RepID=UPI001E27BC08|nr:uncharacterized protein LOC123693349 [Colias croceus]
MSYDYNRPYIGYPPPPMPDIDFEPVPIMPPIHPEGIMPDPVEIVDAPPIDWVPATRSTAYSLMGRAFVAGKEGWDNSPLWAIRVHHDAGLIPGKLAVTHGAAYIPLAGKEVAVQEFEILCTDPSLVQWVSTSRDEIPENAIPAGNTHVGEPLYLGRVKHRGSMTPGKVHPSHKCCYISFGGSEVAYKRYEILCEV